MRPGGYSLMVTDIQRHTDASKKIRKMSDEKKKKEKKKKR